MSKVVLAAFQKTVTTAGTSVALAASSNYARSVTIKALFNNTKAVYLGAAGAVSASTGFRLDPGEQLSFSSEESVDLSAIGLDSDVNGEGVSVAYRSPQS